MSVIWKHPLEITQRQEIRVPMGARFLHVETQHATPCIWYLVDPGQPLITVQVWTFGTGHEIPDDIAGVHLGTYLEAGGAFVWHVFIDKPTAR